MSDRGDLWAHRVLRLAFVILCIRIFPHAGTLLADYLPVDRWSPLWDVIHHGVQLLLTLGVMMFLSRSLSLRDIGFNLNHASWSLKCSGVFAIIWIAGVVVWVLFIGTDLNPHIGEILYSFTLEGLSEELLFRAFVIGMLHPVFAHTFPLLRKGISVAGIISIVLFALAPLAIVFDPFSISYVDPLVQLLTICFALMYAIMFEYSHSLLGPVLVHNLSNGILLLVIYLFRLFGA